MMIADNWTGEYQYDENKRIVSPLAPQKFLINIEEMQADQFWGTIIDEADNTETGKVEGRMEGNTIHFVKKMPRTYAFDEKNKLIRLSGKHPKVYYEGHWNEENGVFSGTWKMNFAIRFHGIMPIPLIALSGTWQMGKVEKFDSALSV